MFVTKLKIIQHFLTILDIETNGKKIFQNSFTEQIDTGSKSYMDNHAVKVFLERLPEANGKMENTPNYKTNPEAKIITNSHQHYINKNLLLLMKLERSSHNKTIILIKTWSSVGLT